MREKKKDRNEKLFFFFNFYLEIFELNLFIFYNIYILETRQLKS
jgi:hypothetical protein